MYEILRKQYKIYMMINSTFELLDYALKRFKISAFDNLLNGNVRNARTEICIEMQEFIDRQTLKDGFISDFVSHSQLWP